MKRLKRPIKRAITVKAYPTMDQAVDHAAQVDDDMVIIKHGAMFIVALEMDPIVEVGP
jgi:hypothetical protein